MNNDGTQALADRLIEAGFAIELQPGTYNLIYSLDNYLEDGIWDADLEADAAGSVELPGGSTISAEVYTRITEFPSTPQISGGSNGFRSGVSLLTDAGLGNDLDFLRDRGLITARLDFSAGGLLIGAAALADAAYYDDGHFADVSVVRDYRDGLFSLSTFGFDGEETSYAVVTPQGDAIDVYDTPGQAVAA